MADDEALGTFTALIDADTPAKLEHARQVLAACNNDLQAAGGLSFCFLAASKLMAC